MLRIELPARLLADGLAAAVWAALGLAVAVWLAEVWTPIVAGLAVPLGLLGLAAWRRAVRETPRSVDLTRDGQLRVTYDSGRVAECADAAGHRVLGRTVYLRWPGSGARPRRAGSVWLTAWDVPAADLRRLAVGLRCRAGRLEM